MKVFGMEVVTFDSLPKDLFALVGEEETAIVRLSTGRVMVVPTKDLARRTRTDGGDDG